jgi:RNA polymerase sigma factor (TIGR02999 family)
MVPLVALEMVRSPIAGPLTPAPTEPCRLAAVAAVRNPSKEAVIATFVPLSTAVTEPEPASSARVLASAGIAERRALNVSLVCAESESPSPQQAIASAATTTREFSTIPAFYSISKWLAVFDSGPDGNCSNLVIILPSDITGLLRKWTAGDKAAIEQLTPLIYNELRGLAHRHLRRERRDHTLQSTALVHEAWLRLVDQKQANWQDRAHFFAVSGQMMRRILVDHARAQQREKRGGGAQLLVLDEALDIPRQRSLELIALDDALDDLAKLDARQSQVIEMRFFAGLSIDETAEALGISKATANRDWVTGRAWLLRELE